MKREEFLNQLRQALEGEVSPDIIEQNIRYYDQYISSRPEIGEEAVLQELGHPRLIAKTIIESERIAREKRKTNGFRGYHEEYGKGPYSREADQEAEQENYRDIRGRRPLFYFGGVRWYHKVILWTVLILFLLLLILIGRVIVKLLYVLFVPILLIVLLTSLFRRR